MPSRVLTIFCWCRNDSRMRAAAADILSIDHCTYADLSEAVVDVQDRRNSHSPSQDLTQPRYTVFAAQMPNHLVRCGARSFVLFVSSKIGSGS